jgi:hypothetical protein
MPDAGTMIKVSYSGDYQHGRAVSLVELERGLPFPHIDYLTMLRYVGIPHSVPEITWDEDCPCTLPSPLHILQIPSISPTLTPSGTSRYIHTWFRAVLTQIHVSEAFSTQKLDAHSAA